MSHMDPKRMHSSNWYKAITLAERIRSLHAIDRKTVGSTMDPGLAVRRMGRWRSQQPFDVDSWFSRRVALDEINEDEFLHLLGEPAESVQKRFFATPPWLVELENAFATLPSSKPLPVQA